MTSLISSWMFCIIITLIAIGVAVLSVFLTRHVILRHKLQTHNDVAAPIHAAISVIYAVLLAFVVVVVWQDFNDAQEAVWIESGSAIGIDRDLQGLAPGDQAVIHQSLRAYVASILETEWEEMNRGEDVPHSTVEYRSLWQSIRAVVPQNRQQEVWMYSLVERMNNLDDARDLRLQSNQDSVPTAMWVLLVCGGLITVTFAGIFSTESRLTHALMSSALAGLIAFSLFLIAAIDHPFIGVVSVQPDVFQEALNEIESRPPAPAPTSSEPSSETPSSSSNSGDTSSGFIHP